MVHPHDIRLGNLSGSELSNVMSDICKEASLDYKDYSFVMSVTFVGGRPWFTMTATPFPIFSDKAKKVLQSSSRNPESARFAVEHSIQMARLDREAKEHSSGKREI
ncbi:MAG: hypothetical protein NUV49_01635 [Patescibacteria group bacterium]|nr:hypothetical protein [Patescibacteria group bacterium]